MAEIAPYGSWRSPLTAASVARGAKGLGEIRVLGEDVYWGERRPEEGGRTTVVRRGPDGAVVDVVPQPFNARTRAHEYGGGAWLPAPDGLYFTDMGDQRIYVARAGAAGGYAVAALTGESARRYADACVDGARGRLIAVCEDHSGDGEAVNSLVAVDLRTGEVRTIVAGADFYSNPVVSPDGGRLAWLEWNHPRMPWDETELWVAEMDGSGGASGRQMAAGGSGVSVFQPRWAADGSLAYVADATGWWNLYSWRDGVTRALAPLEAEFGLPQWVFGQSTYAITPNGRIWCAYCERGEWRLGVIDSMEAPELREIATPFTQIDQLAATDGAVYFRAGAVDRPPCIVACDGDSGEFEIIQSASEPDAEVARYYSAPRTIEFPTTDGDTAHAFYYPPHNPEFAAPEGEAPPLLLISHGGPTGATTNSLSTSIQFWTSRGYGVVDVNYRGSTGYGRAYRDRLEGKWGVYDLDDCCHAALYLAGEGFADRGRLLIRGGSAGGYTTLSCLAFRDVFAGGASYYGVGDLEALARDTHKFESRYMDKIVGLYPEMAELYKERSPIHHLEGFSRPVIVLQGSDDMVVPPNQAEAIVAALRERGVLVAYVLFDGEGHGFRRPENVQQALDAELAFYDVAVVKSGLRF